MRDACRATVLAWTMVLSLNCGVSEGPQGPAGPAGPAGPMGAEGKPASTASDCPEDYQRDMAAAGIILCVSANDEIVKVGKGRSAFWIDRYEASVWSQPDGSGQQLGAASDDLPQAFPKNGQYTAPLYAVSKKATTPSRYVTWFQAQAACRLSGKRLSTRDEWLEAVRGTADPGANGGTGGVCVTQGTGPRTTGSGTACKSRWGAEDMIGNVMEWTDEWYAGLGQPTAPNQPWPQATVDYGNDGTWNITSSAFPGAGVPPVAGIPSAAARGGDWGDVVRAGAFALFLNSAPSSSGPNIGFRCVVPR